MKVKGTGAALLLGAALVAAGCQKKEAEVAKSTADQMKSDDEKAVYALGAAMGRQAGQQIKSLNLSPAEVELVRKGFSDTIGGGQPAISIEEYAPKFEKLAQARSAAAAAGEKEKGAAFCDKAAGEPGAVRTPSGLVFKTLQPGHGSSPKASDVVQVHYRGTTTEGKEFDSSTRHGGPARFTVGGVIPCWTEGLQRMKVGEKAQLICPSDIAYGDRGSGPDIPPGAALVFEVELLAINPR
jgi:FKBP-type peptidyl-prolyl cis-trans isomerase FkpA